jgi:hypothetical protein
MAPRWARNGLDARRRDEAVFEDYGEERQRSRQAVSGSPQAAWDRLICGGASARGVYGPGSRRCFLHLRRFQAVVRPWAFQTGPRSRTPTAASPKVPPSHGGTSRTFSSRRRSDDTAQVNGLINSIPSISRGAPISSVYRRVTPATRQAPRIMLSQCDKLNRSARPNAQSNVSAVGSASGNTCPKALMCCTTRRASACPDRASAEAVAPFRPALARAEPSARLQGATPARSLEP